VAVLKLPANLGADLDRFELGCISRTSIGIEAARQPRLMYVYWLDRVRVSGGVWGIHPGTAGSALLCLDHLTISLTHKTFHYVSPPPKRHYPPQLST